MLDNACYDPMLFLLSSAKMRLSIFIWMFRVKLILDSTI